MAELPSDAICPRAPRVSLRSASRVCPPLVCVHTRTLSLARAQTKPADSRSELGNWNVRIKLDSASRPSRLSFIDLTFVPPLPRLLSLLLVLFHPPLSDKRFRGPIELAAFVPL